LNYNNIQNFEDKSYIPFGLSSLIFYNKENEIKNSLVKELNIQKVKFSEKKNKISCFKKNYKFEINIEKMDKNIFVIKFLRKEERNHFYKDFILNIINVFNK
jgi:cell division protein FtsX